MKKKTTSSQKKNKTRRYPIKSLRASIKKSTSPSSVDSSHVQQFPKKKTAPAPISPSKTNIKISKVKTDADSNAKKDNIINLGDEEFKKLLKQ